LPDLGQRDRLAMGAAVLPAAERLAEIPGVSLKLAREIIAETGLDIARFPTADHLVSWAGLAPVARQSGSRQRKPSTGQGDVCLKTYCAQAANGTGNTGTFLGERLRRLTRRLGGTKAMCAVGRSILVIIWHLPADPAARFTDLGPGWHDGQAGGDRRIRSHLRQLKGPRRRRDRQPRRRLKTRPPLTRPASPGATGC
jgi:transposase